MFSSNFLSIRLLLTLSWISSFFTKFPDDLNSSTTCSFLRSLLVFILLFHQFSCFFNKCTVFLVWIKLHSLGSLNRLLLLFWFFIFYLVISNDISLRLLSCRLLLFLLFFSLSLSLCFSFLSLSIFFFLLLFLHKSFLFLFFFHLFLFIIHLFLFVILSSCLFFSLSFSQLFSFSLLLFIVIIISSLTSDFVYKRSRINTACRSLEKPL